MENSTHPQEPNTANWFDKHKVITGISIVVLFGIVGAIFNHGSDKSSTSSNPPSPTTVAQATSIPEPTEAPTGTPKLTPTFTPTPTEMRYDAYGFPDDAAHITVSDLAKVPSSYENKKITFTYDVVGFPKDDNGNAAGINCGDPNDYSSLAQVQMGAFDQTVKINTNDTVVIYGMGQGAATGKNAYGADVTEPIVLELHAKDLTTGWSE